MRWISCLLLVPLLAGCETLTPAERLAENKGTCESYGFKPNTDAYAQCLLQLDVIANENDYRKRQALAAALRDIGDNLSTKTVTCNSSSSVYGSGNSAYGNSSTTCY